MSVTTALGGRYRLEGLIGRGGMASVWRAHDLVLDRPVAVKRLHARLHGNAELEERFRREGQAVAKLSHPNLVRLLDQGEEADEPFLVFELVEGRDLKTIIRQHGRMPPERAAAVTAQIARALGAAHRAGIIHRDIKSHNVLVDNGGVAKLTDFGIARMIEADTSGLTKTGIVMGSSDYLAPEQAEGKPVDGRSDIYSLGVVLFEALTGRLPFTGDNPVAVATKHVYEPPPDPRTFAPDVPDELAAACLTALAKDARRRFSTADAFGDALDGDQGGEVVAGLDRDEPTTASFDAVGRRTGGSARRALLVGSALIAMAGAGFGIWKADLFDGRDRAVGGAGADAEVVSFTVDDYDPEGDDREENPDEVVNVTDREPSTVWRTTGYSEDNIAGKAGVGLLLSLAGPTRVATVTVDAAIDGGTVQILGDGTTVEERPVLASRDLVQGENLFEVTYPAAQSTLVVWITKLPYTGGGEYPYRASLREVQVRGVANS